MLRRIIILIMVIFIVGYGNLYTVTNTNDSGTGSFRAAVNSANSHSGLDMIRFTSNAFGTITLDSTVTITDGLIIEGPGDGHVLLTLAQTSSRSILLEVDAPDCKIRGLIFSGSDVDKDTLIYIDYGKNNCTIGGPALDGQYDSLNYFYSCHTAIVSQADNIDISGNVIGMNSNNSLGSVNYGIVLSGDSSDSVENYTIGGSFEATRNVFVNCDSACIQIDYGHDINIRNSFFGLDKTGKNTISGAYTRMGISFKNSLNCIVGKDTVADLPNFFGYLHDAGILIQNSNSIYIKGNGMGYNYVDNVVIPNDDTAQSSHCIRIENSANHVWIGGDSLWERNYICASHDGIWINTIAAADLIDDVQIANNYIGVVDEEDNKPFNEVRNTFTGIRIVSDVANSKNVKNVLIKENVIGYNGFCGIHLSNIDVTDIVHNFIGSRRDSSSYIGNEAFGIFIDDNVRRATIKGNFIFDNGRGGSISPGTYPGIGISYADSILIAENSFKKNYGLAIDLGVVDGIDTTFGPGNPSYGAYSNDSIDFPVIDSVKADTVFVSGEAGYVIELYKVHDIDESGYGEGFKLIDTASCGSDGVARIVVNNAFGVKLTAIQTDYNNRRSSEFSKNFEVYSWDEDVSDETEEIDPAEEGAYDDMRNDGTSNSFSPCGFNALLYWKRHGFPELMGESHSDYLLAMTELGLYSKIDFRGILPENGYIGLKAYIDSIYGENSDTLKVNMFDKQIAKFKGLYHLFTGDSLRRQMIILWLKDLRVNDSSYHEATPKTFLIVAMTDSAVVRLNNGDSVYPIKVINARGELSVFYIDEGGNLFNRREDTLKPAYIPEKVITVGRTSPQIALPSFTSAKRVHSAPVFTAWDNGGSPICNEPSIQENVDIVSDGSGGAIVVWEDMRNGTAYPMDIYIQKVTSTGNKLWGENGRLFINNSSDQWKPVIVGTDDGGAIIVFRDNRADSAHSDIYAQRISSDGSSQWGENGVLVCGASGDQVHVKVLSDNHNGAYIVWSDGRSGHYDIYAQHIDSSGIAQWSSDGIAICRAAKDQFNPDALLAQGSLFVVWEDMRSGALKTDIYLQGVNSDGSTIMAENGVKVSSGPDWEQSPRIINTGSNLMIFWEQFNMANCMDIYSSGIDYTGHVQWTLPVSATYGDQVKPIVYNYKTGALAFWSDRRDENWDIYYQYVTNAGSAEFTENGSAVVKKSEDQWFSDVSYSEDNDNFNVVWYENNTTTGFDVYSQWIDADGSLNWNVNGERICGVNSNQKIPVVDFVDSNYVIILWKDMRNNDVDIYGLRVSKDGMGIVGEAPLIDLKGPSLTGLKNAIYMINTPFDNTEVEIYNALGNKVYSKNFSKGKSLLNLSNESFSAGVYFLRLKAQNKIIKEKVVILH